MLTGPGDECPSYIPMKIQTVNTLLISWKDRQKKKQLGSQRNLWVEKSSSIPYSDGA